MGNGGKTWLARRGVTRLLGWMGTLGSLLGNAGWVGARYVISFQSVPTWDSDVVCWWSCPRAEYGALFVMNGHCSREHACPRYHHRPPPSLSLRLEGVVCEDAGNRTRTSDSTGYRSRLAPRPNVTENRYAWDREQDPFTTARGDRMPRTRRRKPRS